MNRLEEKMIVLKMSGVMGRQLKWKRAFLFGLDIYGISFPGGIQHLGTDCDCNKGLSFYDCSRQTYRIYR